MTTILVMHQGGSQFRGSEVCLVHTVHALLDAGYRVLLLRNNAIIDRALQAQDNLIIDQLDCPEIMIDGDHKSLPVYRYIRTFFLLKRLAGKYRVTRIVCNGGLPCQLGVPLGKSIGVPVVCHFHHPAAKRYFYIWLVKFVNQLIFPSSFTASVVAQKCGRDGRVVYNAVDLETRFIPAKSPDARLEAELGFPDDALVVGQVGALVPHKRPNFLIEAFAAVCARLPNLYLLIIGEGPMRKSLSEEISRHRLENRIKMIGYVDDILPYLQQVIDINVLVSTEEGLGISVIEASGCAIPSIVSDCTGLREVVVQNETGYRFSPNDNFELQTYLLKLAQDPAHRRKLGQKAREYAVQKFSLPQYRNEMVRIIMHSM